MPEGHWITVKGRPVYIDKGGTRASVLGGPPEEIESKAWVLYRSGSNAYVRGFPSRADAETWERTNKRAYGRILVLDHKPTAAETAKMRRRRGA